MSHNQKTLVIIVLGVLGFAAIVSSHERDTNRLVSELKTTCIENGGSVVPYNDSIVRWSCIIGAR